jgi:hypothetical protein
VEAIEALILDKGNVLRLVVLGHNEVVGGQPFDGRAIRVAHDNGGDNELRRGAERGLLWSGLLGAQNRAQDHQRHNDTPRH